MMVEDLYQFRRSYNFVDVYELRLRLVLGCWIALMGFGSYLILCRRNLVTFNKIAKLY